jgi:hypothetical protein
MFAYALIAMTKQGKSRKAREMITLRGMDKFPCLVYDVNDEYGEFRRDRDTGEYKPSTNLPTDTRLFRSRYANEDMNMKDFMEIVKTKRNCNIIFEEATAFFKGRTSEELCRMIINKGHTHNNYIFLFHSVRAIPPELLGYMDFVLLFKTNDSEDLVKKKDPKLLPAWLELQTKQSGANPICLDWVNSPPFNKNQYAILREKYNL